MGTKQILVGVNYFAGWWENLPNKWHRHQSSQSLEHGTDWRPDFPERVPLLGCYNSQETMDREIEVAADHGVNFFPILWYYNPADSEREPNAGLLNNGLQYFVDSPYADRIQFHIEFCNHDPFEVRNLSEWAECIKGWLPYLAHPSYLRVGERLVFKVHGAQHFLNQNKGDISVCRERLELLREAVRGAGLGEMLIGSGVMATDQIGPDNPIAQLFDFTCTYMDIPPAPRIEEDYPYEMLADLARAARHVHCHDAIPYVPYLPGGWNPRPWPESRAFFALPTREQWATELRRLREDLLVLPNLGFPLADGELQPAFTTYAWNEFGEGGIVAPTQGDQYMKLEAIRNEFGVHPRTDEQLVAAVPAAERG